MLPLVIPLVFYHGPEPYNGPRDIRELISAPNELIQKLFESFHLIDTHDLADETLREQKWVGIMTFVMKHIYARDFLVFIQPFIQMLQQLEASKNSTEYMVLLLNYLLNIGNTTKATVLVQTIKEGLSVPKGEEIMSIASQLIKEGWQGWLEESMAKGQQKGELNFLLRLLERKFGSVPSTYRQKIEEANSEQIFQWSIQLLEVNDISTLFDDCAVT